MVKVIKKKHSLFFLGLVLVFSFYSVSWILSLKNGFAFDDYTLLSVARFTSYQDLFQFLPSAHYNDRPVRMIFLKFLNSLFGLQYTAYYYVFVVSHLINVVLVYWIGIKIFKNFHFSNPNIFAIISAAVFGIYPNSLMSISWISSTCDFQCCFFALLSIICYLYSQEKEKYILQFSLFCIVFYYLSLRSKEMSLALPVIILLYEQGITYMKSKRIKVSYTSIALLLTMLFYAYLLFSTKGENISPNNPYYQSFNPFLLLRNFIRYLSIYFDWSFSGFSFASYSSSSLVAITLFAVLSVLSFIIAFHKKRWFSAIALLGIGGAFITVLPMVNLQHRLYWYFPSVFMGIFLSIIIHELSYLAKKNVTNSVSVIVIVLVFIFNFSEGQTKYIDSWYTTVQKDRFEWEQLEKLEIPSKSTTIYVKSADDGYNIFFYGPGNALKLIFDDASISVELVESFPGKPDGPFLYLEYKDGIITSS